MVTIFGGNCHFIQNLTIIFEVRAKCVNKVSNSTICFNLIQIVEHSRKIVMQNTKFCD